MTVVSGDDSSFDVHTYNGTLPDPVTEDVFRSAVKEEERRIADQYQLDPIHVDHSFDSISDLHTTTTGAPSIGHQALDVPRMSAEIAERRQRLAKEFNAAPSKQPEQHRPDVLVYSDPPHDNKLSTSPPRKSMFSSTLSRLFMSKPAGSSSPRDTEPSESPKSSPSADGVPLLGSQQPQSDGPASHHTPPPINYNGPPRTIIVSPTGSPTQAAATEAAKPGPAPAQPSPPTTPQGNNQARNQHRSPKVMRLIGALACIFLTSLLVAIGAVIALRVSESSQSDGTDTRLDSALGDFPSFNPPSSPISLPTVSPTRLPTTRPTQGPVSSPSVSSSTIAPTKIVTTSPTATPTPLPSKMPSYQPSMVPTGGPTQQPVLVPTPKPSDTPGPTLKPTSMTSRSPSQGPSNVPTERPSYAPSGWPNALVVPSSSPSVLLDNLDPCQDHPNGSIDAGADGLQDCSWLASDSLRREQYCRFGTDALEVCAATCGVCAPSMTPSAEPSSMPILSDSVKPSFVETLPPTRAPSRGPSNEPTAEPSKGPSSLPTKEPSASPSLIPTKDPTRNPTRSPSSRPSIAPTTKSPTHEPHNGPSTSPTPRPTRIPTASPTQKPSSSPTTSPTSEPTRSPTTSPTTRPTPAPSPRPTTAPSRSPTSGPTLTPTYEPTAGPTLSPTDPLTLPTTSPTSAFRSTLMQEIIQRSPESATEFDRVLSPHSRALNWMEEGDGADLPLWRQLQVWTLVAFAYSTQVFFWRFGNNWLSFDVDECSWHGVTCNQSGEVFSLVLSNNNLGGSLLPELSLLSDSLVVLDVSQNAISGELPASYGQLIYLHRLQMDENDLDGELPEEIGNLINLRILHFHFNSFSGMVPDSITQLTRLTELIFYHNDLTGVVPDEVCSFRDLTVLELDCLELECNCWTRCWYQCGGRTGVTCPDT